MKRRTGSGILIGGAVALAACGGGGSGGGPAPATPVPIAGAAVPAVYRFTLSDTGSEMDRLVARTDFGGATAVDVVVDSRIEPTIGEYEFATRTVTFTQGAVAVESDFGFIVVDILAPITLGPGGVPTSVTIEFTLSLEGRVTAEFGDGIVELAATSSGAVVVMTIDEFEGVLADRFSVPVWQHQTALGWAALDLLRHLIVASADTVTAIDSTLESMAAVDVSCDAPPAAPPPEFAGQGLRRLAWLGSGAIATGDDFVVDYMSCWHAGVGGRGVLFDGQIEFRGLTATVSAGTLTQVGFRTTDRLGGVLPDRLTVAATRAPTAGALTLPDGLRFELRNGVRLTFDMP